MQGFEFSVQAALKILYQSAIALIMFAVNERISSSAEDDQMALPSGHPQAFREKGLTQTLYLALVCADF